MKVLIKKGKKCKTNSYSYPALFYGPEGGGAVKTRQAMYIQM
jgi:hypothetical protein